MKRYEKRGFTLVELLVVIVIIGMLMGMLIPAVGMARARARQTQCANNQKELGVAVTNYQTQKQRFPGFNNVIGSERGSPIVGSWAVALLSDLNRNDLMMEWRMGNGFSGTNLVRVSVFVCPSDEAQGRQPLSYVANCGYVPASALAATPGATFAPAYGDPTYQAVVAQIAKTGVFADRRVSTGRQPKVSVEDIKDGTTQTLLFSERANDGSTPQGNRPEHRRQYGYYAAPFVSPDETKAFNKANLGFVWTENDAATAGIKIPNQLYHFSSNHTGATNATFCDGHQQPISDEIDGKVYCQIMTPWGQGASTVVGGYVERPLNEGDLDL